MFQGQKPGAIINYTLDCSSADGVVTPILSGADFCASLDVQIRRVKCVAAHILDYFRISGFTALYDIILRHV